MEDCQASTSSGIQAAPVRYAMLSVATKAGRVWLWRYRLPGSYAVYGKGVVHDIAASFALVGAFCACTWCAFIQRINKFHK